MSEDAAMQIANRFQMRWMIRRDMPEVLQIEKSSSETMWKEEDFLRVLRQRNCIGMVAEDGGRIVGFVIYELHKKHVTIINMVVLPTDRRRGIGRLMMNKLKGKLSSHRRTEFRYDIRESNLAGQLFLKAMGMFAYQVERNYFKDHDCKGSQSEDAYLFSFILEPETVPEANCTLSP